MEASVFNEYYRIEELKVFRRAPSEDYSGESSVLYIGTRLGDGGLEWAQSLYLGMGGHGKHQCRPSQ